MYYVLTGSIGHISQPIAKKLIEAGHKVGIITSNMSNVETIEKLGATAFVGSIEDEAFLNKAFANADAVYLMIPPKWSVTNWLEYQKKVAHNYVDAIKKCGVKNVLVLSSIGAHMRKGAGPIDGLAYLETKLDEVQGINCVYLRPSYFYYNLFSMIPLIKNMGIMGSNMPESHELVLTHTSDIADVASDILIHNKFSGRQVIYIASDVKTIGEVTKTLAVSINKPEVSWVEFSDEQALNGMLQSGLSATLAEGYTTMGKAIRTKEIEADYWKNKPASLGKVKLEDFAKEFSAAFSNS